MEKSKNYNNIKADNILTDKDILEEKVNSEVIYKPTNECTSIVNNDVEEKDIPSNIKVKVINKSGEVLPEYATPSSAGLDLRAAIKDIVVIPSNGGVRIIPTGLFMAIPEGYECQIRPRSGLAVKHGITVLNTPGTIDADFRNEVCVILINHSNTPFTINPGDRIAQAVFNKFEHIKWEEVDELDTTKRSGGFGSTGIK